MPDAELVDNFARSFKRLDEMLIFDHTLVFEELPAQLRVNDPSLPPWTARWGPAHIATDFSALAAVYSIVPGPFPPLYEQLVLSYRWNEVSLGNMFRLLSNPPAPGLQPLAEEIRRDPCFVDMLFPLGLIPFAKGPDTSYDPVCFDTTRRRDDGDCPIVRVEHEAILCFSRLGETWEVATSFRSLMEMVVGTAADLPDL